jgi:hypothetical protein
MIIVVSAYCICFFSCRKERNFHCNDYGYVEDRINELATHSKNMNIRSLLRGINEFETGY